MSKTLTPHTISSPAVTECTQSSFTFGRHFRRQVSARFDGGVINSDGSALLLRDVDRHMKLLPRLAACFEDRRDSRRIEHRVEELVSQRVYALSLGYEDLNDHDELLRDPLLAGKSTLNRLERPTDGGDRYQKIRCDSEAIEGLTLPRREECRASDPMSALSRTSPRHVVRHTG